jgi:methyl-accepting chemotaxis protein
VAGEVRSLAQRSATAAREIRTLIEDSVAQVEAGNRLVARAGATMAEVVGSVRQVSAIIDRIATVSTQQQAGIEQAGAALQAMEQATLRNAELVAHATGATAGMRSQAAELAQLVRAFKLDDSPACPHHLPTHQEEADHARRHA